MKYNEQNDNELLYLVSENNEDAKEILFKKYKPIIEMKASKLKPVAESSGYDINDLIQEGMIGLSNAINNYEDMKDVKFNTFANLCIDRQLSSFIRNINREKHKILSSSISYESTNTIGRPLSDIILDDKHINPEEIYLRLEKENEFLENIYKELKPNEQEILNLRIQGFTYKEIAKLLNVNEKNIDYCLTKVKNIINKDK